MSNHLPESRLLHFSAKGKLTWTYFVQICANSEARSLHLAGEQESSPVSKSCCHLTSYVVKVKVILEVLPVTSLAIKTRESGINLSDCPGQSFQAM